MGEFWPHAPRRSRRLVLPSSRFERRDAVRRQLFKKTRATLADCAPGLPLAFACLLYP
jgi:hypothetical protein